ncbi:MAG: hypothetical protein GX751_04280 [Desulfuromonadaceae bacterium]|nr:hypothetical protein [Desulfuromonadaceae bacterium]
MSGLAKLFWKLLAFKNTLTFLIFGVFVYFTFFYHERYNKDPAKINPAIYMSFQDIYRNCNAQQLADASKNCIVVVDVFNRCLSGELDCPVSDYYHMVKNLGYDLPPFYVED